MTRLRNLIGLAFCLLVCAAVVYPKVTLPDVIGSGMVLQRDQPVPIWGTAEPGESITVRFAGQTRTATADNSGKWLVRLSPLQANATPGTMSIEGRNQITLDNILVGEVWLVSGQSNMQRLLSETANGEAAIAAANHPLIRLFNVSRSVAFKHAPPPLAVWLACNPET